MSALFTLRPLAEADLPALLHICRQVFPEVGFSEELLREKTLGAPDAEPKLMLAACEGATGAVAGFAAGALGLGAHAATGFIRLMAVSPAHQRHGCGGALLRQLESEFAARGAAAISVHDCPHNYLWPGLDFRNTAAVCFLDRHGFQQSGTARNMVVDLQGAPPWLASDPAELARAKGAGTASRVEIRRAEAARDGDALRAFLAEHWPAWQTEVGAALAATPSRVHIARALGEGSGAGGGGAVLAFAASRGNNRALGWFGPMGTHPALRGRGVGGVLLKRCLADLRAAGFSEAIIPWVGPIRFYAEQCEARLSHCFWQFRKPLP